MSCCTVGVGCARPAALWQPPVRGSLRKAEGRACPAPTAQNKGNRVGLAKLPANQFEIDNEAAAPQGILVRSADMHDTPLPDSLLAIARAGAGTNNIPVEDCTNKGIVVFNTPGANANAVAELVVGALVAGSRNLVDAVNWAQTLKGRDTIAKDVEKGKKAFVGPELRGKTLGVIGLGAIGARVANAAVALGMEVLGYDPYISIDAAWSLSRSVQHCVTLGDMLPRCDYLTIHVPYLPTTRHTINAQTLAMCKDGVRVLNFARGELVDNAALLDALNSGKVAQYFCDFPTEELLGVKGVCCTPHLHHPQECSGRDLGHHASGCQHAGKRDELRRDGRRRAERLPEKRQHHPQRQPAGCQPAACGRPPHLHHPQECSGRDLGHHEHFDRSAPEH